MDNFQKTDVAGALYMRATAKFLCPISNTYNSNFIPMLIPIAIKGVKYRPLGAEALLRKNLLVYGVGGVVVPFVGIKLIDMMLSITGLF